MKHITRAVLLGHTFLLVLALSADVGAQTGTISGQVIDEASGVPLVGASVHVLNPDLAVSAGAATDGDGGYAVENLPMGTYAVEATFVGYRTVISRDIVVGARQSATVNFRLLTTPFKLTETVISASRRAENIVDASVSISKVDAEEVVRNASASSIIGLIQNVKGIDYTQRGIYTETYSARGFNGAVGPNSRMIVLLDGIDTGAGAADALGLSASKGDLQDVEVIVGPTSALYGPNAVASVVSITTRDPRESGGTTVALSSGSRSIRKARFRHAGTRDKWGWKISGEHQQARDFEINNTYYNADSSLAVTENPDFDARGTRGGGGLFYYPDADSRIGFQAGIGSVDQIDLLDGGRWRLEGTFSHYQQFFYSSAHSHLNIYQRRLEQGKAHALYVKARFMLEGYSEAEAKEKARFIGETIVRGVQFRHKSRLEPLRTHLAYGFDFNRSENIFPWVKDGRFLSRVLGVYGHSETGLNERLKFVLAGRVDFSNLFDTRLSPRAALIFKPDPAIAFRATLSQAFRSPGVVQIAMIYPLGGGIVARGNDGGFRFGTVTGDPLPAEFQAGSPPIAPEKNTTYELGFKGVLRNSVFLDISAYQSRYRDFISPLLAIGDPENGIVTLDEDGNPRMVSDKDGNLAGETTWTYLNFGRRTVRGLDVGANVYAGNRVMFKGNFSFIRAGELEKAIGLEQPFNTPEVILNLGVSTSDLLTSGTTADLSLRRVSEFDFIAGVHNGTVPAYTVVNLDLSYQLGLDVIGRLSVRNLLDNKHIEVVDGAELGRIAVAEIGYEF